MMLKVFGCTYILLALHSAAFSQNVHYFTLNNVKARPLAMGGAFTSVEDPLAAIEYNPAAYSLFKAEKTGRFTVFLNPVSPFIGAIRNKELFSGDGAVIDDVLLSLSLVVKSVGFTFNRLRFGVLLGEESLDLPAAFFDNSPFRVSGFRQNHSHAVVGSVKLAEQVAIGGAAKFMFGSSGSEPTRRSSSVGFSYGILLKPEEGLNIGVSYVSLPDSSHQEMPPHDRFVDESVNVGISYRMFGGTLLSLDVRNIGEEQKLAVREFHFGLEQTLLGHLALRAGYYKKKDDGQVFSWGLGLIDGNKFVRPGNRFRDGSFLLNYSFVYEKRALADTYSHLFSFLIRI